MLAKKVKNHRSLYDDRVKLRIFVMSYELLRVHVLRVNEVSDVVLGICKAAFFFFPCTCTR